MKTSVALCTYNGEKFLNEQLDSIINQTTPVDEIIVCDDGSTDDTISILDSYQKRFPETIKIYQNEKNLRSVKNFEKAIALCSHEIIFLSDQDDVWMPKKVEKILKYFDENVNLNVICSRGTGIDESGALLDKITIWDVPKILQKNKIEVDFFSIIAFIENIATGAGMAFRKKFVEKIIPFPNVEGFHHDEWIALNAAKNKSFTIIDDILLHYRVHKTQQVGGVLYENNDKTERRLKNHFDIFSVEKTFDQYKRFLKRISESYKKHQLIAKQNPENAEISKKIVEQCQFHFKHHQKAMAKKFPVRFFFLKISDSLKNKRSL